MKKRYQMLCSFLAFTFDLFSDKIRGKEAGQSIVQQESFHHPCSLLLSPLVCVCMVEETAGNRS